MMRGGVAAPYAPPIATRNRISPAVSAIQDVRRSIRRVEAPIRLEVGAVGPFRSVDRCWRWFQFQTCERMRFHGASMCQPSGACQGERDMSAVGGLYGSGGMFCFIGRRRSRGSRAYGEEEVG